MTQARASREKATIYLVRHGRTILNAQGLLRGHLDPPLDEEGIGQARRLGALLGTNSICLVASSPLQRAVQTAGEIARRAGKLVELEARVIDRDYGPWAGKSLEEVVARFGSIDLAVGVEPRRYVESRAVAALIDIAEGSTGSTSVIVSHDAVNRLLLQAIDPGIGEEVPQETGCYNELEYSDGEWTVISINQLPARPHN